jgi:hypothetical protein
MMSLLVQPAGRFRVEEWQDGMSGETRVVIATWV